MVKKSQAINSKIIFVIFTLFILIMLIFPVFSLGNRVEPFVFGLPFSMAWVIFWIVIEFIGLLIFIKLDSRAEEK